MRNKLDREILTTLEETYYAIFDLEDSLDAKNQEIEVLQGRYLESKKAYDGILKRLEEVSEMIRYSVYPNE
jgi:type II secretory pathway component PulK